MAQHRAPRNSQEQPYQPYVIPGAMPPAKPRKRRWALWLLIGPPLGIVCIFLLGAGIPFLIGFLSGNSATSLSPSMAQALGSAAGGLVVCWGTIIIGFALYGLYRMLARRLSR